MTFYLRPADGKISTNLYYSYVESRLKYLTTLRYSSDDRYELANQQDKRLSACLPPNLDCLIDGTAKDRLSHFALRSIAILHDPLHSYVIQKEQLLFRRRLATMTYMDLKKSVMILVKQLKEYIIFKDEHEQFFLETEFILMTILKKRFLDHRNAKPCPSHLNALVLSVPFYHVLPLVATRDVQLDGGEAWLRCDQITTYLCLVFSKLLEYSSRKIKQTDCLRKIKEDPRFLELLPLLKQIYTMAVPVPLLSIGSKGFRMTLSTLDELSNYFPPCMNALHQTLKSRHRLCHKPRVQYTLFLKDVGLPVDDCLQLIQTEYSRPAVQTADNQKHKCEHSWEKDSRRYRYGTRHLYGLEGARKKYSSHGCNRIQKDSPGPNECGGCPFVHYDDNSLKNFLTADLSGAENSQSFIFQVKMKQLTPIESCHFHLRCKSKNLITEATGASSQHLKGFENSQVKIHNVFKPKHYFELMSKVNE